ncbi:hypothetical protein SDC9_188345 [bioreactor metagenome]|uniref:Uncharacterized protein n=1 Tax=bioreactor metagenome TaxID=1076179 RepID=A0A645HQH8_9ZZZZ
MNIVCRRGAPCILYAPVYRKAAGRSRIGPYIGQELISAGICSRTPFDIFPGECTSSLRRQVETGNYGITHKLGRMEAIGVVIHTLDSEQVDRIRFRIGHFY